MKSLYIIAFQSDDGHATTQPCIASSEAEAKRIACENECTDRLSIDECYILDTLDGYKIQLVKEGGEVL